MADKGLLRALVRSFYDAQKLRVEAGNRLVANVRVRLGQEPGAKTEEMPEEGQKLLKELVLEYKRLTDSLTSKSNRAKVKAVEANKNGVILTAFEYELVGHYTRLLENEEELGKGIAYMVAEFPIWKEFLKDVKGVGPTMAAIIISELDPHKARHASSFWKYSGLDVAEDGRGRSRRSEHLVDVTYTDKSGKEQTRKSITFNPFLKTKLIGVLGSSFLRAASPYKLIYSGYKNRLENHAVYKDVSKGHRHNMAMRYMVKMFLVDLYVKWRELEGLPVTPPYAEAKLGLKHGA